MSAPVANRLFVEGPANDPPTPAGLDPEAVRRALHDPVLPCLCPLLLKRLQPPRYSARFDPTATAALMLDDPALLLAVYAQAARQRLSLDDADPARTLEQLGPAGVNAIIERLRDRPTALSPTAAAALARGYRHALATARLAAALAPVLGVEPRVAAAAGLLHDLGRLLLLAGPLADATALIYDFARDAALTTVCVEQALMGLSHKQMGYDACSRLHAPPLVREICRTHAHGRAQRQTLKAPLRAVTTVVSAADAVAKAYGVPGSVADELTPAPVEIAPALDRREAELETVLASASAAADERWGAVPTSRPLAGVCLALTGSEAHHWTPLPVALRVLGADVVLAPWATVTATASQRPLLVVDCTCGSLADALPTLAALAKQRSTRVLVVAERCREPEARLPDAAPGVAWCVTPLRTATLAAALTPARQAA